MNGITNKKVVFFGGGGIGKLALDGLSSNIEQEIFFGDNAPSKWNTLYCGKKVVGMEQIVEMYRQGALDMILLTVGRWEEIFLQCLENGIPKEMIKFYDASRNIMCQPDHLYGRSVHSCHGEELFLRDAFKDKNEGIYVDIGANHPYRFSNTWWAYQKGWRGINVEPDIKNYELLKALRGKDININCGISDQDGKMMYYEFEESALNTFCKEVAECQGSVKSMREVPVCKMSTIFEKYKMNEIDFMDIDVEGLEFQVLSSINWDSVSIKYILLEHRRANLAEVLQSSKYIFLSERGYEAIHKFGNTVIYERK